MFFFVKLNSKEIYAEKHRRGVETRGNIDMTEYILLYGINRDSEEFLQSSTKVHI